MFWVAKRAGFALLAAILLLTQFQPSFAADTSAPTFSPTVTSRQDGFFFVINNFVNTQTYSAVTTNGYVMLGYPSFGTGYGGSTSNYVGIVYGLNKGETATVTVTASRATYNSTSSQISGSAEVAPAVSSCSPTSTTSGFYTTLKFTATSETVDKFCDWTVPAGVSNATTVVIVGGGGGGGYWGNAGSGGAGAVLTRDNYPLTPGAVIRIVVGAGGAGLSRELVKVLGTMETTLFLMESLPLEVVEQEVVTRVTHRVSAMDLTVALAAEQIVMLLVPHLRVQQKHQRFVIARAPGRFIQIPDLVNQVARPGLVVLAYLSWVSLLAHDRLQLLRLEIVAIQILQEVQEWLLLNIFFNQLLRSRSTQSPLYKLKVQLFSSQLWHQMLEKFASTIMESEFQAVFRYQPQVHQL